jgi:hypothetical protein
VYNHKEYMRSKRKKEKELPKPVGKCRKCFRKTRLGNNHCDKHLLYGKKSSSKNRKKRIFLGLCIHCGKRPPSTLRMCDECNNKVRERRRMDRELVLKHYGDECACCKENGRDFLTVDHVEGNGKSHRTEVGDINRFLIKNNFPMGFQVLCFNCNCAKRASNKCPHQKLAEGTTNG